jgi:nucleoside-diphosphate-sugar epimerase
VTPVPAPLFDFEGRCVFVAGHRGMVGSALVRRLHEAKLSGARSVTIWGSGTPRKLLDVSKLAALGWRARTPLRAGLEAAYADFLANHVRLARAS